jgi:uncharacterized protein YceK
MKKLLLAIAMLFTLTGCSVQADTASASAPEQSEVSAEEKAKPKWGYTKVHIFDGPKGGTCVRIKDWNFVTVGSNCAIIVEFSDETIFKGGKALLPEGTYMLLDGRCPICSD